ncbi:hypothetical protein AB6A40_007407 [Gnathostoma spinigerum]|uniref:BZIP domain-containing protein n=1 Tax=Gnathostoma spinigerum TaxID=75299 RepID=A0ABD6EUH9_9BILA
MKDILEDDTVHRQNNYALKVEGDISFPSTFEPMSNVNNIFSSDDPLGTLMEEYGIDGDLFTDNLDCFNQDEMKSENRVKFYAVPSSSQSSPSCSSDSGNHSPTSSTSEAVLFSDPWLGSVDSCQSHVHVESNQHKNSFSLECAKMEQCREPSFQNDTSLCPEFEGKPSNRILRENLPITLQSAGSNLQSKTSTNFASVPLEKVTNNYRYPQQSVIYILPQKQKPVNNIALKTNIYQTKSSNVGLSSQTNEQLGKDSIRSIASRSHPYPEIRPKVMKHKLISQPAVVPVIPASAVQLQAVPVIPIIQNRIRVLSNTDVLSPSSPSVYRDKAETPVDEFVRKREDRKIRNRASAQLSRIKKRNEVEEMKQKLMDDAKMIERLRSENEALKKQVFTLQNENETFRRLLSGSRARTAAGACLAVFIVMLTIGSGPLYSVSKPGLLVSERPSSLAYGEENSYNGMYMNVNGPSRALLSVDYDSAENSDRLLRPDNHSSRDKNSISIRMKRASPQKNNSSNNISGCDEAKKLYMNTSETIRLNNDLSNWIYRHEGFSFLGLQRIFRVPPQKLCFVPPNSSVLIANKRKQFPHRSARDKKEEAGRLATHKRLWQHIDMISSTPRPFTDHESDSARSLRQRNILKKKELNKLMKPLELVDLKLKYIELSRAVKQRNDTLYVVTMKDYYLLPATNRKSTVRPRLSLILPSLYHNGTLPNQVPMIRIDCEIIATGFLDLPEALLPIFYNQSYYN